MFSSVIKASSPVKEAVSTFKEAGAKISTKIGDVGDSGTGKVDSPPISKERGEKWVHMACSARKEADCTVKEPAGEKGTEKSAETEEECASNSNMANSSDATTVKEAASTVKDAGAKIGDIGEACASKLNNAKTSDVNQQWIKIREKLPVWQVRISEVLQTFQDYINNRIQKKA